MKFWWKCSGELFYLKYIFYILYIHNNFFLGNSRFPYFCFPFKYVISLSLSCLVLTRHLLLHSCFSFSSSYVTCLFSLTAFNFLFIIGFKHFDYDIHRCNVINVYIELFGNESSYFSLNFICYSFSVSSWITGPQLVNFSVFVYSFYHLNYLWISFNWFS